MSRKVNAPDSEPEQSKFDIPSEGEHLLQITDIFDSNDDIGIKLGLDQDTVAAKLEVVAGPEMGRSLIQKVNMDDSKKSFYYCRLFLKAIGEPYKGEFDIDHTRWIGRQLYATVVHNVSGTKTYANIAEYNFEKKIEQYKPPVGSNNPGGVTEPGDIQWDN